MVTHDLGPDAACPPNQTLARAWNQILLDGGPEPGRAVLRCSPALRRSSPDPDRAITSA